jgi:hypothetical protein
MMVIEDVDLMARERTHMHGPGEEVLLNNLLDCLLEFDGVRALLDEATSPNARRVSVLWVGLPGGA